MPTIPDNYPDGCTPEVIRKTIRDMHAELANEGYLPNSVLQYSPLINLGQSELERRQNEAVVKQSKILGYISLGIAFIALAISVWGTVGSTEWETRQLDLLGTISKNESVAQTLTQQNGILEKISTQLNTGVVLKGDRLGGKTSPKK